MDLFINAEKYSDPTAGEALRSILAEEKEIRTFRPIVYICSPYAGDIESNREAARRYSRYACAQGYIPIAPHLLFPQFMNDKDIRERKLGIFFGTAVMSKCAEVWVFGEDITPGMKEEIKHAKWRSYKIRYFTDEMKEVRKDA